MIRSLKPDKADVFIDDLIGKGPKSQYNEETISGNSQIRCFVYEGIQVLQNLCTCVKEAGVMISGDKFVAATPELEMLGATVSLHGAHVTHGIVSKIAKWPICMNTMEVRGFLGTVGVVQKWIKNFAKIARPLVLLTKKNELSAFKWSNEAQDTMNELKNLASSAPPLIRIDYELALNVIHSEFRDSDLGLVTLAVDSSNIGAGWILSQIVEQGDLPALFRSITFKPHESRYLQPKLKL
jgi:hypothetical protein